MLCFARAVNPYYTYYYRSCQALGEFHELLPDLENLTFAKIGFMVKNCSSVPPEIFFHTKTLPVTTSANFWMCYNHQQSISSLQTVTLELMCEHAREYSLVPSNDPPK